MISYLDFLRSKVVQAPESGFDLEPSELSPALKPHQRAAVLWALKGGRRALFESFGLGKTVQQLEWCRQVVRHDGGRALIVLPLGVRQEFRRDAVELLCMDPPEYVRTMAEAAAAIVVDNCRLLWDDGGEAIAVEAVRKAKSGWAKAWERAVWEALEGVDLHKEEDT